MSLERPCSPTADSAQQDAYARIEAAFSAELIETAGIKLAQIAAEHFRAVYAGETATLKWRPPEENASEARRWMEARDREDSPRAGSERRSSLDSEEVDLGRLSTDFSELVRLALDRGINLHHPHYVGHQVPASIPLAGWFDALGALTNQVMAIYEMGPWASGVETAVLDVVGEQIGFAPSSFSGVVTSGASLANMTALLTARNVSLDGVWQQGLSARAAPVLVAHAEAHYSTSRAAAILGLGTDHLVSAAIDDRRAIDAQRLDETLERLRRRNVPIVAVAAAACATPIGAFDPLPEIAEICRRHEVWLHVDAAHGAAACMSRRHRHLVEGLELADSVVCDAHKMFFMPALCTLLFYRDRDHRFRAFHQEAPYLFDPLATELIEYESGLRTVECSKRAAAFGLWGIWSLFGRQLFEDMVDTTFDLAKSFYHLLGQQNDFDAPYAPECNIVVFRYLPAELKNAPAKTVDEFQLRLRRRVVESGHFYLVSNILDERSVLRTTIINPLTRMVHLEALVEELRRQGLRLLAES